VNRGMPTECALSFDNLVTVPKSLLSQRITRLSSAKRAELRTALLTAAGCA
jgi:mRNA-degrading endonuclease toxin of MazEF toxin-antitoxin module